ncbi:hypothetical protein BJY17_000921 [Agromyces hippuratus]|uniref:AbiEi antitoxin C-terminal domain-containing protein n=1 Tax=Agromyces hippuratus TaxID=286438 RepID=A0A852WYJ7_9MICO|nr:hypothetical protein [Agromyces hippuratus]NYG20174.1 hypothetical protein [Agromyces hippuratus]
MAKLPTVLSIDDLSIAELCAARIDGELMMIDEAWAPVDEPDLPSLRAAAVALRAPRTLVIERHSAAWVHGALTAPPTLARFCVPRTARVALVSGPRLVVREVAIEPDEIIEYPRARCTTPVRTGFDLLRDPAEPDGEVESIVTALCADHPGLRADLRRRLEDSTRMPHRGLALRRFDRVEAMLADGRERQGRRQPSLTR